MKSAFHQQQHALFRFLLILRNYKPFCKPFPGRAAPRKLSLPPCTAVCPRGAVFRKAAGYGTIESSHETGCSRALASSGPDPVCRSCHGVPGAVFRLRM